MTKLEEQNGGAPIGCVNLVGRTVLLYTDGANKIQPMVEVVREEGDWIVWRGLFGGRKLRRSRRSRVARVLDSHAHAAKVAEWVEATTDYSPAFRVTARGSERKGEFLHAVEDHSGMDAASRCRLLEAAPEMFRVLSAIVRHAYKNDRMHDYEIHPDIIADARAAIARAERSAQSPPQK